MRHSTKKRIDIINKKQEIIDLYNSGKNSYEIADAFNCSRCLITTTLKRNGIKLRASHKRKGLYEPWNKGKKYLAITGDKNPRWKGGITPINQQVRHCLKYKDWISSILKRDNYTCCLCKKRGGNLEVDHHPKTFCQIMFDNNIKSLEEAENCSELWDINNGRTVCMKCHNRSNIKPIRSRFLKVFSNKK